MDILKDLRVLKAGTATDTRYYHLCDCIVLLSERPSCKLVHPLLLPDPDLKARPAKSSYEEQSDKEGRSGDSFTVAVWCTKQQS